MTKSTEVTSKVTIEEVKKGGDWVKPVIKADGSTVYALPINKTKEDKANIEAILSEYASKGITVYRYNGKEGKEVLLVEASQKIRNDRVSAKALNLINKLIKEKGFTLEEATDFVASL